MLISVLSSTGALAGQFNFLKTLRAFRVFRLFKRVKSLNKIVTSLILAVPGAPTCAMLASCAQSIDVRIHLLHAQV